MIKQALYKGLSLVLSVLCIANVTTVYGRSSELTSTSWESKVQPYLLAKMQTTEGKLSVWLWMEDIDPAEVEQRVYQRTGLREEDLSVIGEPLSDTLAAGVAELADAEEEISSEVKAEFQEYLTKTAPARRLEAQRVDTYLQELRAVQKEMIRAQNASTSENLGIAQEDVILTETQAPVYIVSLNKQEIERLAKQPEVTAIYYYDTEKMIPEFGIPGTISGTTIDRIYSDVGLTGNGVKIGIIDVGKVLSCSEIATTRITYISPSMSNDDTHATNVARIAAGSEGVAPAASIYSSYGSVSSDTADLENCNLIKSIVNQSNAGVHVANCSLREELTRYDISYTGLELYLDYMIRSKRFTLVKAAGNNHDVIPSPGLAYNVITVGGFYNNDSKTHSDDIMYSESSYMNLNGCFKPDLVADQAFAGTSYAAPLVTGTVALLYQLRPALKTQPEAVKAILMASCHRKVNPNDDPVEYMSDGLTDHQGAGAIDPYRAIAIAGSGHYGIRTMSSTATQESIRFEQPAYGSSGLNVSLAWSVENPSGTVAGPGIDLDLRLYRNNTLIKSSTKSKSSTEMVYVTPSATNTNYTIQVNRYSATGTAVRYGYAFSVDHTRYQYTGITEGVFNLKNKATGYYLTLSGSNATQTAFGGSTAQKWLLSKQRIAAVTAANNRLAIGSTISGNYQRAVTNTTAGATVMFQWNEESYEMDGSVSFYNGATTSALGIYNNSTATGAAAAWSPYTSTNTYQQWYLEPVAYQRGDVNIDGTINATDALMVSQSTAGTRTLSDLEKYLADVNGDGQVNTADAQMINQISVGTIE